MTWMKCTVSGTGLSGLSAPNIHREINVCPEEDVKRFANKANRRMGLKKKKINFIAAFNILYLSNVLSNNFLPCS